MAKVKYYYDSETLSYRKIEANKGYISKMVLLITLSVLLVMFLGFIVLSQFLKTPDQLAQERELENLKLNYKVLNKRLDESSQILSQLQERDNNIYRTYFEANPIPEEQRKAGFGGVNRYQYLDGFDNSDMIKSATKKIDVLSKQMVVQSKSLDEIVSLAKEKEDMLASIPAIMPIKKEDLSYVASGYKWRMHPILKIRKFHKGMDFKAPKGTPIYASGNGKVVLAQRSATFGKVVYIDHGYGYRTIYAHMSKIATRRGRKVKRGDIIGYVGNTGRSVASHLHYEVHKNGRALNPINFYYGDLTPEEFLAMQIAAEKEGQSFD
ncbi:M23 family metallopeptidase [Pseudotenacibaculum sp. MALMAid0570]|uniref:M23 family metallopeptidase n=1 Tax=Pseudotenacibaculum sp. MALMAid0570 TaxID=3143938 RepID=UPI0032DF0B95